MSRDPSTLCPAGTKLFWIDPAQNVRRGTSAGRESEMVVVENEMEFRSNRVGLIIRRRRRVHARLCGTDWTP